MKTNNKNKHSARKKLFPAIAMLTTSAIMLSTATYAWFTMSKDVEVKGINLTATVPASLQISLGKVNGNNIDDPANTNESEDWNNIVAFSDTYEDSGLLKPASSINGNDIFYTENADGVGKTIANNAIFTQADESGNAKNAKLKPKGSSVDLTNGDGYYIDIPVWFRTSESGEDNVQLSVKAVFSEGTKSTTGELYKAARVAILDANTANNSTGVIKASDAQYYANRTQTSNTTTGVKCAVQKADTYDGLSDTKGVYGDVVSVTQAGDGVLNPTAVVDVAKKKSTDTINYGTMTKKIIRIWLEGEDTTCWNKNAGQDFNINLTFSTIEPTT